MDKLIKIKVKNIELFNAIMNLPIDGEIQVSDSGIIEVTEECANCILSNEDTFEKVVDNLGGIGGIKGGNKKESGLDSVPPAPPVEDITENLEENSEKPENDSDEEPYSAESLNSLDLETLKEILKDSGVLKKNYVALKNKEQLIDLILQVVAKQ